MLLKSMEHKRHPVFSKCNQFFFWLCVIICIQSRSGHTFCCAGRKTASKTWQEQKFVKKTWQEKLTLIKTHHRICLAWNICNSNLYNCVQILQNFHCCEYYKCNFQKNYRALGNVLVGDFPPRQWFGQPLPYTLSNKNAFSNAATFKKNLSVF